VTSRVLVADDEPLARERIRGMLARLPAYEIVAECGDGASTVEAILRERPDIVLLDIRMPRMSGIDVLKEITAIDSTITVIVITALEHVALAAEAIEHGAAGYVLKPFDLRRLDAVVVETLAAPPRRDRAR